MLFLHSSWFVPHWHVSRREIRNEYRSHFSHDDSKTEKKKKENERGILFDYQFSHNPMVFSY